MCSSDLWEEQKVVNDGLQKLSKELDIPLVVSNDGHYLCSADKEAHEILLCVGTGSFLTDKERMSFEEFDLYVTDPTDIIKRWGPTCPEAITNTKKIADRCNVELELGRILIPTFPTPFGKTEKEYLDELVYKGLSYRYGDLTREEAEKTTDTKNTFTNPVWDGADPWMVKHNNEYIYCWSGGGGVNVSRSPKRLVVVLRKLVHSNNYVNLVFAVQGACNSVARTVNIDNLASLSDGVCTGYVNLGVGGIVASLFAFLSPMPENAVILL